MLSYIPSALLSMNSSSPSSKSRELSSPSKIAPLFNIRSYPFSTVIVSVFPFSRSYVNFPSENVFLPDALTHRIFPSFATEAAASIGASLPLSEI